MSALAHQQLMLASGAPSTYAYWNPSDKSANASLSDSNKVVTSIAPTTSWVRSITSKNSGKWRIQFVIANQVNTNGVGFGPAGSPGSFLGVRSTDWCLYGNYAGSVRLYNNNAYAAYTGNFATSSVVDLLLNINAGLAWWVLAGTPISGDPVAGTGPMATFAPGTTLFIAADPFANAAAVRLRTDPAEMTGASVAGFTDGWPA